MFNTKQLVLLMIISFGILLMVISIIIFDICALNLKSLLEVGRNGTKYEFSLFNKYKKKFNKSYGADEEIRFKNFQNSLKEINRFNAKESSEVFGLTKFSDMSKEEFAERMLIPKLQICREYDKPCVPEMAPTLHKILKSNESFPIKYDWRDTGKVSPVREQKTCRACWAFSVVGAMEIMLSKLKDENHSEQLSIQELIDCSRNNHCRGGNIIKTLSNMCGKDWGVVPEDQYPLTLLTEKCRINQNVPGTKIKEFASRCNIGNEEVIARAIALHGPVLVVVDAISWQNYLGGIIQRNCDNGYNLIHAVHIVGYDRSGPVPYYIIKNSWGTTFGEDGYIKLAMNRNLCGIANEIVILDVNQ